MKPTVENSSIDGIGAISYLLAGIILYGGLGFLGDYFFKVSWLLPLGIILGMGLSIFLIVKRYGNGA